VTFQWKGVIRLRRFPNPRVNVVAPFVDCEKKCFMAPLGSLSDVFSSRTLPRCLYTVQEMVGAAGPLRDGDEVDFMLPTPLPDVPSQKPKDKNLTGSGHAVGAVRVQASEHGST